MRGVRLFIPLLLLALVTMTACSHLFSAESSLPTWHPEALGEGRVDCTECHEDTIKGVLKSTATFNHTPGFVRQHRFYTDQDQRLCASCHAGSFCYDCHANELEIKPPIKLGNRPDRELVHRGDYLTLHKIDGKIDPTGCYRCHGRANNEQCVTCHR